MDRLRRFNLLMGIAHLFQGVAMLTLSTDFALPVRTAFLRLDPATSRLVPNPETLFEVRIGPLVASFLFLSAAAHLVIASPWYVERYRANIRGGMNPARWLEYSLSSTVMIVVIAMLVGIYDIAALIAIAGANAGMIMFGHMMELHNRTTDRTRWTAFTLGSILGAVPWIAVGIYLFATPGVPTFVYWIYVSIFLFFNVFAVNMVLQYRAKGRWRDYVFGERVYIWLSLIAKSLLAWQVFAGTLRPM